MEGTKDLRMIVDETSRKEIAAIREIVNCISVRDCEGIQERFSQTHCMAFAGSLNYFLPFFCFHEAKASIFHF